MVKGKAPAALDSWLQAAEAGALATCAAGLRRDEDAVRAALGEPWRNGQVKSRSTGSRSSSARCRAGPASICFALGSLAHP